MTNEETIKKEEEDNKIWVGEDGIVNIELKVEGKSSLEDTKDLLRKMERTILEQKGEARILLDLGTSYNLNYAISSESRKVVAECIKKWIREVKFKKGAAFSNVVLRRMISSFILVTTGLKNVKVFKTKKEALNWLKKE